MGQANWLEISTLVVLVLLASFFAASEAALISISRLRAAAMAERNVHGAKDVERIVEDRNRYLTSILVANTIVLLAADSLATYTAIQMGIHDAPLWSTVFMTIILLLFGEIIPKTIVTNDGERWALRLAGPMRYVAGVLKPLVWSFLAVTNLLVKPLGIKHPHQYVTEDDIRALVNVGAEQRVIEEEEREMIPLCVDLGVGIIPWSPLARGLLAGTRARGGEQRTVRSKSDPYADSMYKEADFDVVDVVCSVAKERGLSPAQIALSWLLGKHAVSAPIVGATKLSHLEDAVAAVEVKLSAEDAARLEAPYQPHSILGHN